MLKCNQEPQIKWSFSREFFYILYRKKKKSLMKRRRVMYFLEFPQNVIGYVAFRIYTRKNKRPYYKYRDAYVIHVSGRWGAISLSRYIFADDHYFKSDMIKHEYGHTIQSKKLLILYLPVIGIPSLIWNRLFRGYRLRRNKSYYSFYTESWANELGGYKVKD